MGGMCMQLMLVCPTLADAATCADHKDSLFELTRLHHCTGQTSHAKQNTENDIMILSVPRSPIGHAPHHCLLLP
jgi:hypothetical protein